MDKPKLIAVIALAACYVSLIVIAAGVFTRLVDAGLGCPDWPGCYGHLKPPTELTGVGLDQFKAWTEMIHRYLAKVLGLVIVGLVGLVFYYQQTRRDRWNKVLSVLVILLLIYQVLLGRYTVTLQLMPVIVSKHLLGALSILMLLWLMYLRNRQSVIENVQGASVLMIGAIVLAIVLLYGQIFLGVWTSTHYAALSCPDFPFCINKHLLMPTHFKQAFDLVVPTGINYEGGVLPTAVRQTIQMTHRLGALVLTLYLFGLVMALKLKARYAQLHGTGSLMLALLMVQLVLGISNVIFQLPIMTALSHTIVAALLLMTSFSLLYQALYSQNELPRV